MNTPIQLTVTNYQASHGGLDIIIDGRDCSICSVVGYALYNNECPVDAVTETLRKMQEQPYGGHKLAWINLSATALCGDKGYYEKQAQLRAAMPKLHTGDVIRFEGRTYRIDPDHNRNYRLTPFPG